MIELIGVLHGRQTGYCAAHGTHFPFRNLTF